MVIKKTHSIADYIRLNQIRKNIYWRIADNQAFFQDHETGIWFEGELFDDMYPKYEYLPYNPKGQNVNSNVYENLF